MVPVPRYIADGKDQRELSARCSRSPQSRKQGFTLVELLVVIAIIGVLMAMLLAALHSVRESARQITCLNNLKQIGLALQHYHKDHRRFPAGCQDTTRHPRYGYISYPPKPPHTELAWNVFLLPYLDQNLLYEKLDLSLPFNAEENAEAAAMTVPVFLCPSTDRDSTIPGQTDYAGINGEEITRKTNTSVGVLVHDRAYSEKDIRDGPSQTLIVSEDTRGPDKIWIHGRNIFNQRGGINDPDTEGDNEIRSDHAGGAMGLFADGHVLFLTDDTNHGVLAAMISRAGGEFFQLPKNQ